MWALTASTHKLQIKLGGSVSATQPSVHVYWVQYDTSTPWSTPGSNNTTTNNTTAVDLVSAPSTGIRDIKRIVVYNRDSAAVTIKLGVAISGTLTETLNASLSAGSVWCYDWNHGIQVFDSAGSFLTANTISTTTLLNSTYHSDTLTGTAARGALIVGNSTPKWAVLTVGAANRILCADGTDAAWAQADHGAALTGLSDDDHTQYALLAGRSSGQTLIGGTASGENLTLNSTSDSTKGLIKLGSGGGHITIGGSTAASELRFLEPSGSGTNYTAIKAQAQTGDVTYTLPAADGTSGYALVTNGSGTLSWASASGTSVDVYENGASVVSSASRIDFKDGNVESPSGTLADWYLDIAGIAQGRLTTETGVAISTSDRSSQGTIYYTPFAGSNISLYDGTRWKLYRFTECSLALTATSGSNYDVFLYDNSGTLTLELSAAWTSATARNDALTTQDGVYVKSGATTRRWLGTIRASGSNVTEDSVTKRFVWNAENRVDRPVRRYEGTASWNYSTATIRQANGSTSNQVAWVCGLAGASVLSARLIGASNSSATDSGYICFGVDSTTAFHADAIGQQAAAPNNVFLQYTSAIDHASALGYHYAAWLEKAGAGGTMTWYGTVNGIQYGITGHIAT